jgi:hypothetical protein
MVPASSSVRVIMGAAAPAEMAQDMPEADVQTEAQPRTQLQTEPQTSSEEIHAAQGGRNPTLTDDPLEKARNAILQALTDGNRRVLVSMLDEGEWAVEGNEVIIRVSSSATVIDMSFGADARRLAVASASGALGRPVKVKVIPGAAVAAEGATMKSTASRTSAPSNGGGRSRAEQEPVVQRMREKFGAQIRTVIDYKEKR